MTISRPSEIERGAPVFVRTKSGETRGTVIERWHGPITGDSYVVGIRGGMVIAPVSHVRRPSESEGLMALKIRGGITGAGEKRPPHEGRKTPWTCVSGHENPRYATRCLTLGCNTAEERRHYSDCATNNEPAFPRGACDCGGVQ